MPFGVLLPLLLVLAACQRAGPPVIRPAPAPVAEPVSAPAPPEVIRANWSFQAGDTGCTARATGGNVGLTVMVRRTGPVRLSIALGDAATAALNKTVSIRFVGPTGRWDLRGVRTRRSIEMSLPLDDIALSRMLVLLNGGTLYIGDSGQDVPRLRLPVAGSAGQRWFGCARDQLI